MSLTLLVSTYNRTGLLANSLERLAKLTQPDELIVIDDGGRDGCEAMLSRIPLSCGIRYIYNNRPYDSNPCQARNIGIRRASSDEILICEPEILFLTDVIAQLLSARMVFPTFALFGPTLKSKGPGLSTAPKDVDLVTVYPHYTLYRREWLEAVGGYDEALTGKWGFDDVDLNQRLGEIGHPTILVSSPLALHQWHEPRNDPHAATENEVIMRRKVWPDDIIANRDRSVPWGTIRT